MDWAALAAWTPVAVAVGAEGEVAIDWGDLRALRFAEPFFQQTVERWAGGDPAPLVRTGIDALEALDEGPSLDPAGFIFHLSRCGSTLCARLLGALEGVVVLSEPPPINAVLMAAIAGLDEALAVRLLRLLVRALGRVRWGDERRLVVKLSSWNVCRLPLFRRAFPAVPIVWLQREPMEVMASLLADPPGWAASLRRAPQFARALTGAVPEAATSDATLLAEALAGWLHAMAENRAVDPLTVDYRDLPGAAWRAIAPHFGLALDEARIPDLCALARIDAKSLSRKAFSPRPAGAAPALSAAARAVLAERALPLYRALAQASPTP